MIVLSFGCTKNLDEKPVSIISGQNYYNNDTEFNAAINGAFAPLFSGWGAFDFNGIFLLTGGGEDIASRATAPELGQWDLFQATLNGNHASTMWNSCYSSINAANQIILKAPLASSAVSDANKASYEAQARFIRALSYFYLVRFWGEVPIVTVENVSNAKALVQSPVADIYNAIIADLTYAENNLPPTQSDKARPTKGAAKAILAKVYLTMAGWPIKDATKYALARDKALEVMGMGYQLQPNFGDLWLVANKFTSKEYIFILNGNSGSGSTSSHYHPAQRPGEEGGWSDVISETRFFNVFPAGPRKDYSFWTVFADANHTTWQASNEGSPYIAKFRDAGAGATRAQASVSSNNGDGFFPIIRYADVLLMFAEAANMAENGPSTAATDAINLVRRRAGSLADLPYLMNKAAFDAAVIAERNWELAFEGNRWFDLVRKEMVESANASLYPNLDKHNYLLPKPGTEVYLMPGVKQNDGY